MDLFASYHDQEVLEFRKKNKYEDIKGMIMSKSIVNVLRVAGIQCALRVALEAFRKDKIIDTEDLQIQLIDMGRAVVIVKYSVDCLISLIYSTSTAYQSKGVKRPSEMPYPEVMDSEFPQITQKQNSKTFFGRIPISAVLDNH